MFGRLILIALQLAVGWFAAPEVAKYLPKLGQLDFFGWREIIGIVFTQTPGGRNPRDQFKAVVEASVRR